MNWLRRCVLFCLAMLLVRPAVADYWISVGSFGEASLAESAAASMAGRVGQSVAVARYDVGGGTRYRIVMGPYPDMDRARSALADVRRDAVPDAWIVNDAPAVTPAPLPATPVAMGSALATPVPSAQSTDPLDVDALLRSLREPLPDVAPYESSTVMASELPAEPVTEVPPGYQLNRLRRDAADR